jgi:hypothetical protein
VNVLVLPGSPFNTTASQPAFGDFTGYAHSGNSAARQSAHAAIAARAPAMADASRDSNEATIERSDRARLGKTTIK